MIKRLDKRRGRVRRAREEASAIFAKAEIADGLNESYMMSMVAIDQEDFDRELDETLKEIEKVLAETVETDPGSCYDDDLWFPDSLFWEEDFFGIEL